MFFYVFVVVVNVIMNDHEIEYLAISSVLIAFLSLGPDTWRGCCQPKTNSSCCLYICIKQKLQQKRF